MNQIPYSLFEPNLEHGALFTTNFTNNGPIPIISAQKRITGENAAFQESGRKEARVCCLQKRINVRLSK